jgi:hypothetical protein
VVECIEHLRTELELGTFGELPVFQQGQIPVLVVRAAQVREIARCCTERAIWCIAESTRVEPLRDRAVRQLWITGDVRPGVATERIPIGSSDS